MRCCPPLAWPWLLSILGAPKERRRCPCLSRKTGQPSHPPTGVDGAPKSPFGCSVFKDRGPWHFCGTEKRYPLPHCILLKIGGGGCPALAHQLLLQLHLALEEAGARFPPLPLCAQLKRHA